MRERFPLFYSNYNEQLLDDGPLETLRAKHYAKRSEDAGKETMGAPVATASHSTAVLRDTKCDALRLYLLLTSGADACAGDTLMCFCVQLGP